MTQKDIEKMTDRQLNTAFKENKRKLIELMKKLESLDQRIESPKDWGYQRKKSGRGKNKIVKDRRSVKRKIQDIQARDRLVMEERDRRREENVQR